MKPIRTIIFSDTSFGKFSQILYFLKSLWDHQSIDKVRYWRCFFYQYENFISLRLYIFTVLCRQIIWKMILSSHEKLNIFTFFLEFSKSSIYSIVHFDGFKFCKVFITTHFKKQVFIKKKKNGKTERIYEMSSKFSNTILTVY